MIKLSNVSKSYEGQDILSKVSFVVNNGEKVGLVGPNGSGKSTLLRMVCGKVNPDAGTIEISSADRIAYVPQTLYSEHAMTIGVNTLRDYLASQESTRRMLGETEPSLSAEAQIKKVLVDFDLAGLSWDRVLQTLSGGQRTRLALACAVATEPTVLLLDEPSNNLDLTGLSWLAHFLKRSEMAVLIVSHDRWLLDQSITKVIEIDPFSQTAIEYAGDYSDYISQRENRRQKQHGQHLRYKEEKRGLEESIQRQRQWTETSSRGKTGGKDKLITGAARDRSSKSSGAAKRLKKKLQNLERVEDVRQGDGLRQRISNEVAKTMDIVIAEQLSFSLGGNLVFSDIDISIHFGDRIAILGRNGAGKPTLLRLLTGELEADSGRIVRSNVKIGYLTQEHDWFDPRLTVMSYARSRMKLAESDLRSFLARFEFSGGSALKRIEALSPGEQSKLRLAEIAYNKPDCLVLDEPTNHLDVDSMEFIEREVREFSGAVVIVSHDRYFLERMRLTKYLLLAENGLVGYNHLEDLLQSFEQRR